MKKIILLTLLSTFIFASSQITKLSEKTISKTKYSEVKTMVLCVGSSKVLITHSYAKNDYANGTSSTLLEVRSKDCLK